MTDRKLLLLVVTILGAVTLLSVGGVLYLAAVGRAAPDLLQNVAVGGVTALAAVLPGAKLTARQADVFAAELEQLQPPAAPAPPVAPE